MKTNTLLAVALLGTAAFLYFNSQNNNNNNNGGGGGAPIPPGTFVPGYGYTETQLWVNTAGQLVNNLGQLVMDLYNQFGGSGGYTQQEQDFIQEFDLWESF